MIRTGKPPKWDKKITQIPHLVKRLKKLAEDGVISDDFVVCSKPDLMIVFPKIDIHGNAALSKVRAGFYKLTYKELSFWNGLLECLFYDSFPNENNFHCFKCGRHNSNLKRINGYGGLDTFTCSVCNKEYEWTRE